MYCMRTGYYSDAALIDLRTDPCIICLLNWTIMNCGLGTVYSYISSFS